MAFTAVRLKAESFWDDSGILVPISTSSDTNQCEISISVAVVRVMYMYSTDAWNVLEATLYLVLC